MAIFPLAPDQTIAQTWSNGVREDEMDYKLCLLGINSLISGVGHVH